MPVNRTLDLDLRGQGQTQKEANNKTKGGKRLTKINAGDGIIAEVDDSEFEEDGHQTMEEDSDGDDSQSMTAGCTASTVTEAEKAKKLLTEHPELKHLFNSILDERINEVKNSLTAAKTSNNGNDGVKTPNKSNERNVKQSVVKSPSDTTIYRPVFRVNNMQSEKINSPDKREMANEVMTNVDSEQQMLVQNIPVGAKAKPTNKQMIDQISVFVDNLRMDYEDQHQNEPQPGTSGAGAVGRSSEVTVPGQEEARQKVDRTVLEAERFKATINNPPGMSREFVSNTDEDTISVQLNNSESEISKSDDDFMHLTCHVDPLLVSKIEKGEFVELERLLPKDRYTGARPSSEQKLEWVRTDEGTYLVPSNDKTSKINSFRKWEQAFRVYATIYCGANPVRSKEIWQYVSVISTAASSFIWDNVANYDYTFRQLMAFNPKRSWAITYHHMWSLAMKDPIPKGHIPRNVNYFGGGGSTKIDRSPNTSNSSNKSNSNSNGGQNNNLKKWTKSPTYCWSFNRGLKCSYGNKCRYIERCSFCDSQVHGINACPKFAKEVKEGKVVQK